MGVGGSVVGRSSICGGGSCILEQLAAACSSTTTSARPSVVICCAGAAPGCCVGADLRKTSQTCHGGHHLNIHCTAKMMRSAKLNIGGHRRLRRLVIKMAGVHSASFAGQQYVQQISEDFFKLSFRTRVGEHVQWALQQQTHLVVAAVAFLKA